MKDVQEKKEETPAPVPRRKIGYKQKIALLEVIERKRLGDQVNYKAIALRTGVPVLYLRQLWMLYKNGGIDMGDPTTPEEKQIDSRMQHEKMLLMLRRYKSLLLNGFEATLIEAEDLMASGNRAGWKESGLPHVLKELKAVTEVQTMHEKGYASILEEYMALQQRAEKQLNGNQVTAEVETKVVHANDEEKALGALKNLLDKHEP